MGHKGTNKANGVVEWWSGDAEVNSTRQSGRAERRDAPILGISRRTALALCVPMHTGRYYRL